MSVPDDETPRADAVEQAADVAAAPEPAAGRAGASDDVEVPEADAIEQSQDVLEEDEDYPRS
jgi:hypothetical protein